LHGAVTFLISVRDMRGSNPGRDTDYTDDFRDIPRTLQECDWLVLRSGPLTFRQFLIHQFVIGGSAKNNFTVCVCDVCVCVMCVCVMCVCVCVP